MSWLPDVVRKRYSKRKTVQWVTATILRPRSLMQLSYYVYVYWQHFTSGSAFYDCFVMFLWYVFFVIVVIFQIQKLFYCSWFIISSSILGFKMKNIKNSNQF